MMKTKVLGVGHYLPENVVTNDDIASRIDTTDEWITERTGIKQRRWFNPDKVFLKREVINQLKEHDFYEKEKFE